MHHSEFVYNIVKALNCKRYLELGIYTGETFSKIVPIVEEAVGVDSIDLRKKKIGNFYECSTEIFFESHSKNSKKFDVIFIDADHSFASAIKDFNNSINFLNKNGTIIIHDTDPISKKYTDKGYCGDSYRVVNYIKGIDEYDIITLPITEAGLSIVRRHNDRRVLEFI